MKVLLLLLTVSLAPQAAEAARHSGKVSSPGRRIVDLPTPAENQGSIESYFRSRWNPCKSGPRRRCL
ncbi:MAG: hypothetical protein EOP11_14565 [Proteobacteria bacterium]|nr:MAG: hypothetical protein EOP11_14565 [Pseudomonadota bacterium]